MLKVYGDAFMIATRMDRPSAEFRNARACAAVVGRGSHVRSGGLGDGDGNLGSGGGTAARSGSRER